MTQINVVGNIVPFAVSSISLMGIILYWMQYEQRGKSLVSGSDKDYSFDL
jgi:hypothetical protein